MATQDNMSKTFTCDHCNYGTNKSSNFGRHKRSNAHKNAVLEAENTGADDKLNAAYELLKLTSERGRLEYERNRLRKEREDLKTENEDLMRERDILRNLLLRLYQNGNN
jgi:hypothetical protein